MSTDLIGQEARYERPLTPCGNIVCTGCRICGCPALGIAPQEARDDERKALTADPGAHGGPIPMYGMLDLWMALHGAERSEEFEPFYAEHGYAETWARLLHAVRSAKHPEPEITDEMVERAAHKTFEPDGPGGEYTWAEMVREDPTRADLWRADARAVLEAALRVPVGEGGDRG